MQPTENMSMNKVEDCLEVLLPALLLGEIKISQNHLPVLRASLSAEKHSFDYRWVWWGVFIFIDTVSCCLNPLVAAIMVFYWTSHNYMALCLHRLLLLFT